MALLGLGGEACNLGDGEGDIAAGVVTQALAPTNSRGIVPFDVVKIVPIRTGTIGLLNGRNRVRIATLKLRVGDHFLNKSFLRHGTRSI